MKITTAFTLVLCFATSPALAEVPYLDDRSSAASLIKSLYNAVNRREYARAYDYFSTPPAQNFESYVKGYDNTMRVDVATGTVTGEGAAGSVYYTVPVAIKSYNKDGSEKVFAGCYTVRAVNPQVQDPPFKALRIESGKLKASDAYAVDGAVPDCGNEYEEEQAVTDEEAISAYLATYENICGLSAEVASGEEKLNAYDLTYTQSGSNEKATAQLFRFPCSRAAYNESHVYLLKSGIEALQPLSLAEPEMDIVYGDENSTTFTTMAVKGLTSSLEATNSEFNPEDQSITAFSKWRGISDASSHARYVFTEGRFVLHGYQVDPTYDEEINPYDVVVKGAVLPKPQLAKEAQ